VLQHRKLACASDPGGCPPCQKVNAWCTVTDPLTGTPTYRGEFEYLERRVVKQQRHIEELISQLNSLGQDCKYEPGSSPDDQRYQAWTAVKAAGDTRPWDRDEKQGNGAHNIGPPPVPPRNGMHNGTMGHGAMPGRSASDGTDGNGAAGTDLPMAHITETYVGVSTARGHTVSSRLNMFGLEMDLADFTAPDADDRDASPDYETSVYDRSYCSAIATFYGGNERLEEPPLPSAEEAQQLAETYIHVINTYTPILDNVRYRELVCSIRQSVSFPRSATDNPQVGRAYRDHRPDLTLAESLILHLTFGIILLHSGLRNQDQAKKQIAAKADRHYHYALGQAAKIANGGSIEDVQVLALICVYVRNFPRPEVSWALTTHAFARLIELGYHRAVRPDAKKSETPNRYEVEMQKRIFWTFLTLGTVASGKLGRPMPIRVEDFDVEMPQALPDGALTDDGIDIAQTGKCSFRPAIEIFKLAPVYMDLYNTLYAAKRPAHDYAKFADLTERRVQAWINGWPSAFREPANDMDKMTSAWFSLWTKEIRLLLHHPSLDGVKSQQAKQEDLRVCLNVSHEMLTPVKEMQRLKALEGTWHNCALFMLAIQTTLYGYGQLRDEMTPKKMEELRNDMSSWMSVMGDMGVLLGESIALDSLSSLRLGWPPFNHRDLSADFAPRIRPKAANVRPRPDRAWHPPVGTACVEQAEARHRAPGATSTRSQSRAYRHALEREFSHDTHVGEQHQAQQRLLPLPDEQCQRRANLYDVCADTGVSVSQPSRGAPGSPSATQSVPNLAVRLPATAVPPAPSPSDAGAQPEPLQPAASRRGPTTIPTPTTSTATTPATATATAAAATRLRLRRPALHGREPPPRGVRNRLRRGERVRDGPGGRARARVQPGQRRLLPGGGGRLRRRAGRRRLHLAAVRVDDRGGGGRRGLRRRRQRATAAAGHAARGGCCQWRAAVRCRRLGAAGSGWACLAARAVRAAAWLRGGGLGMLEIRSLWAYTRLRVRGWGGMGWDGMGWDQRRRTGWIQMLEGPGTGQYVGVAA